MLVKNYFSATSKVAMAVVALFGMAACGNVSENKDNAKQVPMTEVEQAQVAPQVYRTAFLPTESTPDFVDAAEASVNAVVHIKTTIIRKSATYNDFFGAFLEHLYGIPGQMQNNTMVAYGSGVVLSPDGYIVTNNHVVEGADEVEVTFNNKVVRQASIVGTDPTADLALIKVDGADFDYLVFGDSDKVMKLTAMGGGACILKHFWNGSDNRVRYIEDICATAKGYELLALNNLKRYEGT